MIVDSHQHFWTLSRGDYRWLTEDLAPLRRDFGPRDLDPLADAAGVDRTVLVQAADTLEETRLLLDIAAREPRVGAVVGWVDLAAPEAVEHIDDLGENAWLRGLRPMLADLDDDAWMLGEPLWPALRAMAARGLVFDALVAPRHLPHLCELAARNPGLRIVVDHGAKPSIGRGRATDAGFAAWERGLRAVAAHDNTAVKLSGLLTEATDAGDAGHEWRVATLRPYAEVLLESFGPRRVLWGSDWPVVELAGGYAAWWRVAGELLAGLDDEDRARILGRNARRIYGIR